jgi:hypothetical protein
MQQLTDAIIQRKSSLAPQIPLVPLGGVELEYAAESIGGSYLDQFRRV